MGTNSTLEAWNVIGDVKTDIISFVLAGTPEKPPNPLYINYIDTRTYKIQVNYDWYGRRPKW